MDQHMGAEKENPMLEGLAHAWHCIYRLVEPMALNCAVDLRIADIIASHGRPISLSEIAAGISNSPSPPGIDIPSLSRIMRMLTHMKLFTAIPPQSAGGETLYGLNHSSKWLLHDAELSLAPLASTFISQRPFASLLALGQWMKEGGGGGGVTAFGKVHGHELWEYAFLRPEFNREFNISQECLARITAKALVAEYRDGFRGIGSLVDVGGGTGSVVAAIVKAHPHLQGINFDLPHVVSTAPVYPGVAHVPGDMFKSIPLADAIQLKSVLHDWSDEDCIRILKNCRKAIPEKSGKVIILDVVLQPNGDDLFHNVGMITDLLMLALCVGGKERTESEWKRVLEEAGFPRYKIIKIPALQSIIEAYPH